MKIVILLVSIINICPGSCFICTETCSSQSSLLRCSVPSPCEVKSDTEQCHDKQCLELVIGNTGHKVKETTLVNSPASNLKISSVELIDGHVTSVRRSVKCNLGTSIRYNRTTVFIDPGCKVNLLVYLQVHYGKALDLKALTDDCVTVHLSNKGPLKIVSADTNSRHILSMTLLFDDDNKCIFGKTFGFYKWHVFTRQGCTGRFRVCLQPTSASEITAYEAIPDESEGYGGQGGGRSALTCTTIRLLSRLNRPVEMRITDTYDNDVVVIRSLKLVHQESETDCTEEETFNFSDDVVHAWGGCRGTFQVCYESSAENWK
ncbi:hypothetical protein Btru_000863 [Bulinus truncatus]|nr:hypothetical protein Btru_000863 [Bulinus truncatus]